MLCSGWLQRTRAPRASRRLRRQARAPSERARSGHLATCAVIARFLARGANPNQVDTRGQPTTPLLEAVRDGHVGAVRALVAGGADINLLSPLHAAAECADVAVARALLELRASPNARNREGCTVLDIVDRVAAQRPKRFDAACIAELRAVVVAAGGLRRL